MFYLKISIFLNLPDIVLAMCVPWNAVPVTVQAYAGVTL